MRFSSDSQRRAVFANLNMPRIYNMFSRDDVRVRKLMQDIESGVVDASCVSNDDLSDINEYLTESEDVQNILRDKLRSYGASNVHRMGKYNMTDYRASLLNKPIVASNVVITLGKVLTADELRYFDDTGRLNDSALNRALRYYQDNFGNEYELNRSRFEEQIDKMLTSVHGRSAVDALIKRGNSEFAKKSDAVIRNEILVESLLNEYDFEDSDKDLLRPILKARGDKLGFSGTDTMFGLDDFDLGLLLDDIKRDEKVAQDFIKHNYMHKYFKNELQVIPVQEPLKSKNDDISSYKALTSFETNKKSKPWDQKVEKVAIIDGEYYTPLTSFVEDDK